MPGRLVRKQETYVLPFRSGYLSTIRWRGALSKTREGASISTKYEDDHYVGFAQSEKIAGASVAAVHFPHTGKSQLENFCTAGEISAALDYFLPYPYTA